MRAAEPPPPPPSRTTTLVLLGVALLALVAAAAAGTADAAIAADQDVYSMRHVNAPPDNLPQTPVDVWEEEKERRRAVLERFKARMQHQLRSHNET